MPEYNRKDEVTLAYQANVKRLRLEGRLALDRLLNDAVATMTHNFNAGLERGEILDLRLDEEQAQKLLGESAKKVLNP